MRLGQFINTRDDGGAETILLSLTEELVKRGYDTEIHAFLNSWMFQESVRRNLPVYALPDEIEKLHSIRKLPLFGKAYGIFLKERGIDVLHSHVYGATLRGAAGAYFGRVKHIATQHDNHSIIVKKSRTLWLNLCGMLGTKLVMISNQMLQHYTKHGVNKKYCSIVYNGINEKSFTSVNPKTQENLKRVLGINENDVVYVAAARLQPIKGYDILIEAFKALKDENFKLIILGDGPLRQDLEFQVNDAKLEEKIKFMGAVNNVGDYFSIADVFTLASHNEGLPCSIIEAMFSSLPVVVTNIDGNQELVCNNATGFLVPPGKVKELSEKLLEMQRMDENSRKLMGMVAAKKAERKYTIDYMVNAYLQLYAT